MNSISALVVYESMFGNTESIAGAVADGLGLEGADVSILEVGQATPADVAQHNLIVVGAPTHAFSLSRQATREDAVRQGADRARAENGLREWLLAMKGPSDDTPRLAACFDTRVTQMRRFPKSASTRAGHLLAHNGYTLIGKPTGFVVQGTAGPLVPGEIDRARSWGRVLAQVAEERLESSRSARL
ncbi:flavodoxin domain-containing protein [Nocardioides sp.]|uniref:flavodoxin family protein n=1 Tax=Nocardioides sp. TaxID=35761 RepID=UPI0031FF28F0|nr:hypothetical protein [Nocardioides sp.]